MWKAEIAFLSLVAIFPEFGLYIPLPLNFTETFDVIPNICSQGRLPWHILHVDCFIWQINAYILCGKLKSAYLIAVKAERMEDVKRIAGAAERSGQVAVKNICDKWLNMRQKKQWTVIFFGLDVKKPPTRNNLLLESQWSLNV